MIRTQIYIPEPMHQQLVQLSTARKEPVAKILREFITKGIQTSGIDTSGRSAMRAIANLKFKGGPKDLSKNLDHYLYGGPKKP